MEEQGHPAIESDGNGTSIFPYSYLGYMGQGTAYLCSRGRALRPLACWCVYVCVCVCVCVCVVVNRVVAKTALVDGVECNNKAMPAACQMGVARPGDSTTGEGFEPLRSGRNSAWVACGT